MLWTIRKYQIDGVVLAGTNGEYFSLMEKEIIQMTEIAAEVLIDTNINLVVGGSALSARQQINLGRRLQKAGAQALLNMAPFAVVLTEKEYYELESTHSTK